MQQVFKQLMRGTPAGKWQSWNVTLHSLAPEPMPFPLNHVRSVWDFSSYRY